MTTRAVLLSCGLSLSIGVAALPRLASGEGRPSEPAASVDLSGRWAYNASLSDDAREKMRPGRDPGGRPGGGGPMGPGGGGMGGHGGGRMGPPPGADGDDARESMRAILEPAEELAIAQTGTEIVIDEKFGRTRRLHPAVFAPAVELKRIYDRAPQDAAR